MEPTPHQYLSTACFHGHHDQCRRICKWCPARCVCECHGLEPRMTVGGTIHESQREPSPEELGEPL
jgi:hypothetical protein